MLTRALHHEEGRVASCGKHPNPSLCTSCSLEMGIDGEENKNGSKIPIIKKDTFCVLVSGC